MELHGSGQAADLLKLRIRVILVGCCSSSSPRVLGPDQRGDKSEEATQIHHQGSSLKRCGNDGFALLAAALAHFAAK